MPAILKPGAYEPWLDPQNEDAKGLKSILEKGIVTDLASYPVSKMVNSVSNNDPSCIQPIQ
jgi:putative SOS response-associated peptidase YedK